MAQGSKYLCCLNMKIRLRIFANQLGEVSEWLKEQPWKGCVWLVCTAGSNPALSVVFCTGFVNALI